jgi:hypothetical protein
MASSTSLQDATSDLCTKLLDDVRDLRSTSAQSANYLSKSKTRNLPAAPAMLRLVVSSLRALEEPLMLLRNEIESCLPLEDLHQLSKSAEDTIFELQRTIQMAGRRTLGTELLLLVAETLYTIHKTAIALAAACKLLDDDLAPITNRWTDDDDDDDSLLDLKYSVGAAMHDQLVAKLESDGRECPICLEEMGADTTDDNNEPLITGCGHVFCAECIERVVEEQQRCPMCRQEIQHTGLLFR